MMSDTGIAGPHCPDLRHPYNKRPMNLFRALLTVSGFTLLSRVTGLARETLIARAFGASQFKIGRAHV